MSTPASNRPYSHQNFALGGISLLGSVFTILVLLEQTRPQAGRLWPFGCALAAAVYGFLLIYRGLSRSLPQAGDIGVLEGLAPAVSIQSPARAVTPPPSFGPEVDALLQLLAKRTPLLLPSSTISDRLLQAFAPKSLFASPEALTRARQHLAGVCAAAVFFTATLVWVLFATIVLGRHLEYRTFGWTMLLYLAGLLLFSRVEGSRSGAGIGSMVVFAGIAIALTPLLSARIRLGMPSTAFLLFGLGAALLVLRMHVFFVLFKERVGGLNPGVQVSERSIDIRETLHPESLFQTLITVFDRRRWSQQPNICYLNFRGGETGQTGSFSGDLMLEMSPSVEPLPHSGRRSQIAWTGVLLGAAGVAAVLVTSLQAGFDFGIVAFSLFLVSCGVDLLATAEFFHSEVLFRSQLVLFLASGTFSTSRLTYGASLNSQSRSENELTRLEGRATIYIADLVSGAFPRLGAGLPFAGVQRFVLACTADETGLEAVVSDWQDRISGTIGAPQIPGRPPITLPPAAN